MKGSLNIGGSEEVQGVNKILCFPKNSRKFATPPSPALDCYWLYQKLSANSGDCSLPLRALKVSYSDSGEGGVAVNCEKNSIFPEHPVGSSFAFNKI